MSPVSRRTFLQSAALVPAAFALQHRRPLADRFSDLRRHFVFEYYPWYRTDPWEHWPEGGHHPPADFGSNYVPALGLYDSRPAGIPARKGGLYCWLMEVKKWIVATG